MKRSVTRLRGFRERQTDEYVHDYIVQGVSGPFSTDSLSSRYYNQVFRSFPEWATLNDDQFRYLRGPSPQAEIYSASTKDTSTCSTPAFPSKGLPVETVQNRILQLLEFESMTYRETEVIIDVRPEAFEWIWDGDAGQEKCRDFAQNFTDWLSSSLLDSSYCITGEPGSGKSTLMGILSKHEKARRHLMKWARSRDLIVATFFFSSIGDNLQQKLEGLLRSLLHQLLQARPDVTPRVFSDLWARTSAMDIKDPFVSEKNWTLGELQGAFQGFLECAAVDKKTCFCFFIDGIDEVIPRDVDDTIELLSSLSLGDQRNYIKLCFSSRPDVKSRLPLTHSVQLQDISSDEMEFYLRDRFLSTTWGRSREAQKTESIVRVFKQLVHYLKVVFLWLRFVTDLVIANLTDNPILMEIEIEFHRFPKTLQDLFRYLVVHGTTDEEDRANSILFSLMDARRQAALELDGTNTLPTLRDITFAYMEEFGQRDSEESSLGSDHDIRIRRNIAATIHGISKQIFRPVSSAVDDSFAVATPSEVLLQCETTLKQIKTQTKGLIQPRHDQARQRRQDQTVHTRPKSRAQPHMRMAYAHRAVSEFTDSLRSSG